ncbi:hypothetical protein FA15DRAFT_616573 [Coprinopsis marcescibilis]|nr:hypothetical protein FA15DRAFT_616573 [Coprinopsis marcescibilis]
MASLGSEGLDPASITGPVLLGTIGSYLLFGIYLAQLPTDHYVSKRLSNSQSDHKVLQILVILVTVFELVAIVAMGVDAWESLIVSISLPERRLTFSSMAPLHPALNGLISLCVQGFFARRILILKWNKVDVSIAYLIFALSIAQLIGAMGICVQFALVSQNIMFFNTVATWATLHLVSSLACDTLITVSMVIKLNQYKKQIAVPEARSMLRSLSINTVENGLVTTLCVALNLGFYFGRPQGTIHVAFHWLSGRIYGSVLLASVNNFRGQYRENSTEAPVDSHAIRFRTINLGTMQTVRDAEPPRHSTDKM